MDKKPNKMRKTRVIAGLLFNDLVPKGGLNPALVFAAHTKAREVLNWQSSYADLDTIIRTAFDWHVSQPAGYCESE